MKGYYRIDSLDTRYGKLELFESLRYGDEAEAIVTLDGKIKGYTWGTLSEWAQEHYYISS